MLSKILMNYEISEDRNIYSTFTLEKITVDIEIIKSVTSDNCFINIKQNGKYVVLNKLCTAGEYIMYEARQSVNSLLQGDFFFEYETREYQDRNFDYKELGKRLFLFYDDLEA